MSVSSFAGAAGGLQPYEQIFTSSGTWTKPTGVKTVEVTVVGGSAGYYSSGSTVATAAGGFFKGIIDVSAQTSVPITVGNGGTTTSTSINFYAGGTSSFGSLVASAGSAGNSTQGASYYPSQTGWYGSANTATILKASGILNFGDNRAPNSIYRTPNGTLYMSIYSVTYGQNVLVYSTNDGLTWNQMPSVLGISSINGTARVYYYNGTWIASGYSSSLTSVLSILFTSTDGFTWTQRAVNYSEIAVGPAGFVKTAYNAGVQYSTDGITWTNTGTMTGYVPGNTAGNGVIANSAGYYVFAPGTTQAWYSTNATTWTVLTSPSAFTSSNTVQSYMRSSYSNSPLAVAASGGFIKLFNGTATYVSAGIGVIPATFESGDDGLISGSSYYYLYNINTGITQYMPGSPNGGMVNSLAEYWCPAAGSYYTYSAYKGNPGNYSNSVAPGAAGGGGTATSGYIAPAGIDGWAAGVGIVGGSYTASFTYGSGVAIPGSAGLFPGIQGVVRVRWWA